MNHFAAIQEKIMDLETLRARAQDWKAQGKRLVFTNGCFDLLHFGHIHYLASARDLGDILIVALNSGPSIRRLKGPTRPINDEKTRAMNMASLFFVDAVIFFEDDTPLALIESVLPDILVKGGDWKPEQIVGASAVLENGGQVLSLPFQEGFSTTAIEQKIKGS